MVVGVFLQLGHIGVPSPLLMVWPGMSAVKSSLPLLAYSCVVKLSKLGRLKGALHNQNQ